MPGFRGTWHGRPGFRGAWHVVATVSGGTARTQFQAVMPRLRGLGGRGCRGSVVEAEWHWFEDCSKLC
jgi:hypothetical protein